MKDERTGLTTVKKVALKIIDDLKERVMNDCDDEEITSTLTKWHPESNRYFKQGDFVTADKAMSILHLGSNRNKFFALIKQYGIENHKISNQNVGYLKSDIEELAYDLEEVQREQLRKKRRKKLKI